MNNEMNEIELDLINDLRQIEAEFIRECAELEALDEQDAGYIE